MMRLSPTLLAACLACAPDAPDPEPALRIVTALSLASPCTLDAATPLDRVTLLDIGVDDESANGAVAVLQLAASVGVRVHTAVVDGEERGISFASSQGGAEDVVFVEPITRDAARRLQADAAVRAALVDADARFRVLVRLSIAGTVPPVPPADPDDRFSRTTPAIDVVSPPFELPIDLCAGCLVPQCAADEVLEPVSPDGVCVRGQDEPWRCRR